MPQSSPIQLLELLHVSKNHILGIQMSACLYIVNILSNLWAEMGSRLCLALDYVMNVSDETRVNKVGNMCTIT